MLSADAELDIFPDRSSFIYCHLDQLSDSFGVQCLEWIFLEDILIHIFLDEFIGVISGES